MPRFAIFGNLPSFRCMRHPPILSFFESLFLNDIYIYIYIETHITPWMSPILSFFESLVLNDIYIYRNTHNPMNVSKWRICMISGHTLFCQFQFICPPHVAKWFCFFQKIQHNHVCTATIQSFKDRPRKSINFRSCLWVE